MEKVKRLTKIVHQEIRNVIHLMRFLEYRLLSEKFYAYKYYVKTGRKTFDVFIEESKSDLTYFSVKLINNDQLVQNRSKEREKILSIFLNRKDLIEKYFEEPIFNLESAKKLIIEYDSTTNFTSQIKFSEINKGQLNEEKLLSYDNRKKNAIDLSVIAAKRYYKFKNKSIHMGTRIGGYLFISEYLKDSETESRRQIWERLTDFHFGDEVYLSSPWTVKSSPVTTIKHLNELLIFFKELRENNTIGDIVDDIIEHIQRDIKKLQKK